MIHKESDKGVYVDGVHMLAGFREIAELNLILHVVDLLLSRIITHGSHQVWQFIKRDGAVETAGLRGVLILTSDH